MKAPLHRRARVRTTACALAAACAAAVGASAARAEDEPVCPSSTDAPYRMQLRALTGPVGADLTIAIDTDVAGCAIPAELKKVQLKTYSADGSLDTTRNLTDVAARGGVTSIELGQVPRNRKVEASVLVQAQGTARTFVVRGEATTRLRPDLVVDSVEAPNQVLAGRPFTVSVVVAERNGDVGATAAVALPGATLPVDVAAGGKATVVFTAVTLASRGHVELAADIREASPAETIATNNTRTTPIDVLLPPDLVVESISPKQTLAGKPAEISAVIAERNGDVEATADVSMSAIPGSSEHVVVPPGGRVTARFAAVTFDTPLPLQLTVQVQGSTPAETDTTNNAFVQPIDVTEHELPEARVVLFPSLLGYGAQFNNHLYAPITAVRMPPGAYPDVEAKVKALEPQLVRIFYNDNWEENADGTHPEWQDNYASFVKVVQLAQEAGATIDISYQNLANITRTDSRRRTPEAAMKRFADAIEDLVRNHGLTSVRWATAANEPNSPCERPPAKGGCPDPAQITLEQYEALNRALNSELIARGLRAQISMMAGGFIESAGVRRQYAWLPWAAEHFGDIVDAYAVHVYWQYNDAGRLEYRLRDTYNLTMRQLPPEQRKPVYMMEFGIRGLANCGTKPTFNFLYYGDADCTEIWRTNIAGFQQLWFAIDSAQLGVAGATKWDAYWAVYDRTSVNQQLYWMTGPPNEGYPLTPTYHAMSLLYHVTAPGWQIIRVEPWSDDDWDVGKDGDGNSRWDLRLGDVSADHPEKELTAYAGPNGELTIMGLDTNGRDLNGVSDKPLGSYSIGGLPANTTFNLALWNATGDGTNSVAGTVTTNTAGVARFEVPLQAAFALTTIPVS